MINIKKEFYQNNIIEYAYTFLDKPYVWGAKGIEEFDCSGFTKYIYQTLFNIDIEKDGYGAGDTTKQMTSPIGILKIYKENDISINNYISNINKGDLLFFHRQSLEDNYPTQNNRYPGHVGIYIGNNKFIHASKDAGKIIISELDNYWKSILVASKNIIEAIMKY